MGMRAFGIKFLWWVGVLAALAFGFKAIGPNEAVVAERLKMLAPWLTSNILAFSIIAVAAMIAGFLIWEETAGRLLRRRHALEIQRQSDAQNVREVPAEEAMRWLANESVWAWKRYASQNYWEAINWDSFREFEKAAQRGKVRVRGQMTDGDDYRKIDPGYWQIGEIDEISVESPHRFKIVPRVYSHGPSYYRCVCAEVDIELAWPKASGIRRLFTSIYVWFKVAWFRIKGWPGQLFRFVKRQYVWITKVGRFTWRRSIRRYVTRQIPLS